MAKRGVELMARNSSGGDGPVMGGIGIGGGKTPPRDDVAPWERMLLGSERVGGVAAAAAAAGNANTAAATAVVRRKRASRILSGSYFSRGS